VQDEEVFMKTVKAEAIKGAAKPPASSKSA